MVHYNVLIIHMEQKMDIPVEQGKREYIDYPVRCWHCSLLIDSAEVEIEIHSVLDGVIFQYLHRRCYWNED